MSGMILNRTTVVMTTISAVLCDAGLWVGYFRSRSNVAGLLFVACIFSACLASVLLVVWGFGRKRTVVALLALASVAILFSLGLLFRLGAIGYTGTKIEIGWLIASTNLALFVIGRYGRGMWHGEGPA
jgi:hypothetical protein